MLRKTALLGLLILVAGVVTAVSAQESNRAALVIVLEKGQTITRCVEFTKDTISGYELLSHADVALTTSSEAMGASVCGLEGVGCPADDCFCQCKGGGDCVYWSYWHLSEDEWRYSQAGAGRFQVKDGMVEGWTWGPGSPQNAPQPPRVTFAEVCNENETASISDESSEPAVPVVESSNQNAWLGYGLLGLIVVVLGGLMVVRGQKNA